MPQEKSTGESTTATSRSDENLTSSVETVIAEPETKDRLEGSQDTAAVPEGDERSRRAASVMSLRTAVVTSGGRKVDRPVARIAPAVASAVDVRRTTADRGVEERYVE